MILICSTFNEGDFVGYLYFGADLPQGMLYFFSEDFLSVFGRTDEVVEKKRDVVAPTNMLAHAFILPLEMKPERSAASCEEMPGGLYQLEGASSYLNVQSEK